MLWRKIIALSSYFFWAEGVNRIKLKFFYRKTTDRLKHSVLEGVSKFIVCLDHSDPAFTVNPGFVFSDHLLQNFGRSFVVLGHLLSAIKLGLELQNQPLIFILRGLFSQQLRLSLAPLRPNLQQMASVSCRF